MPKILIETNETLIIPGLEPAAKNREILKRVLLITFFITAFALLIYYVGIVVIAIAPTIFYFSEEIFSSWNIINHITIKKDTKFVYVNNKKFLLDDLLFLSMHEYENFRIIRLEAKRKNIIIPNQRKLITTCSNYQEALSYCRKIQSFISPNLKINRIGVARGKRGKPNGAVWDFVQ